MKTPRILLILVPILFLAASSRHQAFSSLRFGMSEQEASKALTTVIAQTFQQRHRQLDLSDVRNHFITTGTKQTSKLAGKDGTYKATVYFTAQPVVSEVYAQAPVTTSLDAAKETWEVMQDIGDAKFTRTGKKGAFPAPEAFVDENTWVTTDTWDAEGVRVELIVKGNKSTDGSSTSYTMRLKATDSK